jgi:hypothetical protein
LEIVEGGFFLRKKPLSFQDSVKSRIENAVKPESTPFWYFYGVAFPG